MNCFIKALSIFVFMTFNTLSQEFSDSLNHSSQSIKPNKGLSSTIDDLYYYLDLHNFNKIFLLNTDPNTTWFWTSYAISNQATFQSNANFKDMTLPLYQKYLEDSKFNPFRYALGMVQAGAVGYLAYTHIKKYGFLKK